MLPEFANCPHCHGTLPREHYAREPLEGHGPDHEVTLIYCEFCRFGRETLWQVRDGRPRSLRWYLDCGSLEWLRGPNERLHAALRERGASARLVLRNAGHNWTNWRNGLAGAFRFALGVESPELDPSNGS